MERRSVIVTLPPDAVVVLVGPSGSGKSTFATRHFMPSEVISSDALRAMVADDPNDQTATEDAFELLHAVLGMRLARRRLTVVDATNVEGWARERILSVARRLHRPAAAIVFDLPLATCLERNAARPDRRPPAVVRRQHAGMRASLATLAGEGFEPIAVLTSTEATDGAIVERSGAA